MSSPSWPSQWIDGRCGWKYIKTGWHDMIFLKSFTQAHRGRSHIKSAAGEGRGGRPNADNCWRGGRGGNPNADHCPLLMAIQQQFTAQCTCSKNVSNLSLINLRWRCLVAPNNAQATILGMCPIQQNEPVTRWDFFQVTQQDVQENSVVKPWNCAPLLRGQAFNGTERRNTEKEWLIDLK